MLRYLNFFPFISPPLFISKKEDEFYIFGNNNGVKSAIENIFTYIIISYFALFYLYFFGNIFIFKIIILK